MKKLFILLTGIFLIITNVKLISGEKMIDDKTKEKVKKILIEKFGVASSFRIEKGVDQVAKLWIKEDGSIEEFETFCKDYFISDLAKLNENFNKLSTNFEVLYGHYNKIGLDLRRTLDLDWGEIFPIDNLFGQYDASAHLTDDLFKNKIAFFVCLNFPYYSLEEKINNCKNWSRLDWAYARMGDAFTSRVPAEINQKISTAFTNAGIYISEYNILMGNLIDKKGNSYFPKDMKLISHWGLRDELKARYSDKAGLEKQKMIYDVMKRIIKQEIPEKVINSSEFLWNPGENKLLKDKTEIAFNPEPNTRYLHLLNSFNVLKELDTYYPSMPSHVKRKFEGERELTEAEVEKLFTELASSDQVKKVAKLIKKRLGRDLQPFDIWYDGFKSRSMLNQEELDKKVSQRYPDIKAFEKDIKNILTKLGFTPEKSAYISEKIEVDPARGSGHAAGASMKSEKAHLRTRSPKSGMDYKGFNIAMHELGHCVEQTLTLQNVDHYFLSGVPNTAFTEAFAFVFQGRDLDVLGIENNNPEVKYLNTLDNLWATYEIIGVSLVDMKVWNWMYANPNAKPEELKNAVIKIAIEVWNKYYSDIFGSKDQPILAVYSHMIDAALYLPDYPLGHLICFQIENYLEGKNLGTEMERMCIAGRIIPQEWMKNAVGSEISIKPLIKSTEEALQKIK